MYTNSSLMVEWCLYRLNSVNFIYLVVLDWFSIIFSFVVFLISSIVVLYSSEYMGEYNYSSLRFLFLVLLFVIRILLIILSPNIVSIILGWDGLGLISYCLVIYYNSIRSYLSGIITCLINRLGDIGLLVSISWTVRYGGWNFMFYLTYFDELVFYIIIVSAFTKRAQIPFSVWLPAAIAAPTPVSALVHSSTLVTAGVYLLIRFRGRLIFVNNFFLFIRLITILISSICAIYEFDLKKIIALSTLSQLGLIISCLFVGFSGLSFFHLLSHAIFKSLLFLCSGIYIHYICGSQDIRNIGSICLTIPFTSCCFNISNIALCGIPFLSGFYSKDTVIESLSFIGLNVYIIILFYISLGLTSFYRIRLFYFRFLIKFNFIGFIRLSEDIFIIKLRILVLSLFSVSFGCLYLWLRGIDISFIIIPFYLKILTLLIVILGFYLGYELINCGDIIIKNFYLVNGSIWFIYRYSYWLFSLGYSNSLLFSSGLNWGEFYGGIGLSFYLLRISNSLQLYSLRRIKIFYIIIFIWLIILI